MTDRHLHLLDPATVDQLEIASHSFPSPRPLAPNTDLSPDLHHWRSGVGSGRFTVDSGGGYTLGGNIRGIERSGIPPHSCGNGKGDLDLDELSRVSGQASEIASSSRQCYYESAIGIADRAPSSRESRSDYPMLSKDADNSSTLPTPISTSIQSVNSVKSPQDHAGVLLTGPQAEQDSPEPCSLSHSLPSHCDSWGHYPPPLLNHNYSSVPSSPSCSLPPLVLDFYRSQSFSLGNQSVRDHTNHAGNGLSDLSDSQIEQMRLRNNLLLGSGISHQLSTDLISPTQSENTFSTSPIISTSFPFSKYHHQNNDEELTSSSPVLQSYRSIKHEPTHLNNPEVYGCSETGLYSSANFQHYSSNYSSTTPTSDEQSINNLGANLLPTQTIPQKDKKLKFSRYGSTVIPSGVTSSPKSTPYKYSPISPAHLTHGGLQGTLSRLNLHPNVHSSPLSRTLSPSSLSNSDSMSSLALSNVLQDATTSKDPSALPNQNMPKKGVIFISAATKQNVSNNNIHSLSVPAFQQSPSQPYDAKDIIASDIHTVIAANLNKSPSSTNTSSPFSPSSPVTPTPWSSLNQSLYSKESSSSHIGYQNLSLASSNPTNDKFAVELWKLYGPAYQELPPDNNSLESLVRQLKAIGLDVDQIRQHWHSLGKGENSFTEASTLAQNQCRSSVSFKSEGESEKTEFLESFKPPENQKSKCTPFDSLNPVQETKKLFGVTQSSELERGRMSKKASCAPRAGNRENFSSAIEMDWRTQSRSRSRPPETTMMNWRNSSLSRTRASDQTIRFTEGEGYNFLPSLLPPDSFNIKFESSSAKTCDKKWCEGISTRPMSLSPLPCQAILPQSLNGSPTNGEELISSGDTIPEKWPQNSQSPVYLLRSMQSCPKNSPTNTRDSSSSSYPVLSTNNGSNNHTDLFSGSRLSQNLSFLAPDNSLHSTSSASAGMMSDYDSIDFSMKPHFQNSMLGSIPGLNEDFAKLANAHAEYGSIPRVVRKTSFDETLAHQIQKSVALGSFCNAAMTEFINPLVMMNDPGQLGLLNLEQPSILTDGTRTNTLNGTMSYTGYHKKFVMEDGLQKSAGQNFHWNQADQSLSSSSNIQDTRSYEYINQSLNLNNSSKNLSRGEESRNLNLEMEYSPKTVLNTREVRGDDISVQVFRNEKNTRSAIGESAQSHHSNHAILCNDLNSSNEKLDSSELKSAKMFSSTNHGDILQDEKSSKFSGGRSVQVSSIVEARRRTKQLPYLTLESSSNNNVSTTTSNLPITEDRNRKNSGSSNGSSNQTQCLNCKTKETPLWRRDGEGKPLCNACGLFVNLHGISRPAALSTGIIKRRNRLKNGEKEKLTQKQSQRGIATQGKSTSTLDVN